MAGQTAIVVLANSAKMQGVCIAGRELGRQGSPGSWIRPVIDQQASGLPPSRIRYQDGRAATVLDIAALPLGMAMPHIHQHENRLLDRAPWEDLAPMVDGNGLWLDGHSSACGSNDRVPEGLLAPMLGSLKLVRPAEATICRTTDLHGRPKLRAYFSLGAGRYNLAVTDPMAHAMLGTRHESRLSDALFCISLGLPFQGYAYKLVASILVPNDGKKRP